MLRRIRAALFRYSLRLLADGRSTVGAPGKNRSFSSSVRHALRGILYTFINERNFRFECAAAAVAVSFGVVFNISRLEWSILTMNVAAVLALELKNTATELTTDMATKDYHYGAKGSKDASSGAVLIAALSSLVSGFFIFGPRLLSLGVRIVSFLHNR